MKKERKKKNDSYLPSWVGRIFSLAIEALAGAVGQQPAFSQCCFLPPLQRFYSCIGMGGKERSDLSRLTRFYWGFTAGLNEGLQERLLCHLGCPQPFCYTVFKTGGEDCFKTQAWTLRHITVKSGFECFSCKTTGSVWKVMNSRCCPRWWKDCNLKERKPQLNQFFCFRVVAMVWLQRRSDTKAQARSKLLPHSTYWSLSNWHLIGLMTDEQDEENNRSKNLFGEKRRATPDD